MPVIRAFALAGSGKPAGNKRISILTGNDRCVVYSDQSEIFYDHLRLPLTIVADKRPYGVLRQPGAMAEVIVKDAKDAGYASNHVAATSKTQVCEAG